MCNVNECLVSKCQKKNTAQNTLWLGMFILIASEPVFNAVWVGFLVILRGC